MATTYIYNGFGGYHERDGKKGWTLKFAGQDYFFPFGEVTPLVDTTMRELDQDKSTGGSQGPGELTYMLVPMSGHRLAHELLDTQIPFANKQLGIIPVTGRPTGKTLTVSAGFDLEGNQIMVEVMEKEATKAEIAEATSLAQQYKERNIQNYLQSKRERMLGEPGRKFPDALTAQFMAELEVADVDDISNFRKQASGLDPATLEVILRAFAANKVDLDDAVASVRKAGKAQVTGGKNGRRSQNLAEHAAKYDAEQAALAEKE